MSVTTRRLALLLTALALFGLVGAACSSDSKTNTAATGGSSSSPSESSSPSSTAPSADYSKLYVTHNGSG